MVGCCTAARPARRANWPTRIEWPRAAEAARAAARGSPSSYPRAPSAPATAGRPLPLLPPPLAQGAARANFDETVEVHVRLKVRRR